VPGYDGHRRHDGAIANDSAGLDHGTVREPDSVADHDRARPPPVIVANVDERPYQAVAADSDAAACDDVHAVIADASLADDELATARASERRGYRAAQKDGSLSDYDPLALRDVERPEAPDPGASLRRS
jgi:hypothetical protein